jgi:hypothetical protein
LKRSLACSYASAADGRSIRTARASAKVACSGAALFTTILPVVLIGRMSFLLQRAIALTAR